MMGRKKVFSGNWKMNKTVAQTESFVKEFLPLVKSSDHLIILIVPFTNIAIASHLCKGSRVLVGAQNIHEEEEGPFTGEVSAKMVKSAGAEYVILGHSERRNYFQESSALVNRKIKMALKHGLKPILCIGETLDERQEELTEEVLRTQLEESLQDLTAEEMEHLLIAYEPIWAIGTGVASSTEEAEKVHAFCRRWVANQWNEQVADKLSILYGGSVKEDNIVSLLTSPDIDGGLVGGASLNAISFSRIVNAIDLAI